MSRAITVVAATAILACAALVLFRWELHGDRGGALRLDGWTVKVTIFPARCSAHALYHFQIMMT